MKEISIKQMNFVNFKGLRDMTVTFNDKVTTISGHNASGKTSIFDGFTWLLFGKDSQDRRAFDIKTIDENGNVIPRIPHEVSAILSVNGEEVRLCRRFNEKWVKRRGQSEEEFIGHEEERLYNDVPMSLKEWNEKIGELCSEQVFKFITNPRYFVSQKTDVQRAMLFRMAGNISDEDIAGNNPDFKTLLASLTGKTMEEYKKEIQAKKRRIKDDIEAIPDRIDERKRDTAVLSCDFESIEKEMQAKQAELSTLEEQLYDVSKQQTIESEKRVALLKEIGTLTEERIKLANSIKEEANKEYQIQLDKYNELKRNIDRLKTEKEDYIKAITEKRNELNKYNTIRDTLIEEWRQINAETLIFSENDFVCPTCKRPLEIDDIERKQQEMKENFNLNKSNRLQENLAKGKANKQKMQEIVDFIDALNLKLQSLNNAALPDLTEPSAPNINSLIDNNEEHKRLISLIAEKQEMLNQNIKSQPDNSEQKSKISALRTEIDGLKKQLNVKELIAKNEERITELEGKYRTGSQEIADLERIEFTIADFNKARIEAVESRINGMFSMVKFKMYEQQINGGEIETCEAMADGKPYSTQNNAMQVNMGLDIINAICKFEGVTAPIFIDNCESIENVLDTQSQQVRMYVSNNQLTIK